MAALVVAALLAGGLTQVARQSQGYDANSNATLAAQGAVLADTSNATSRSVRTLLDTLPTLDRQTLEAQLDAAVEQTATQSRQAVAATGSTPAGSPGAQLAGVFAERARSMVDLRGALDGLLGLEPASSAGAAPPAASSTPAGGGGATLSATAASNEITAVGSLLARSDDLYRSVRRTLATSLGHARLPASAWVADPGSWRAGTVAALVDQVAGSPTLSVSHYVVLRTVRLAPPPLPTPPGAVATAAVLSPTTQLDVTAVLANQGAAAEPSVHTTFTLADQASGATVTKTVTTALRLSGSVTLPTVTFAVQPGATDVLTVQVIPPAGQTLTNGTVYQLALHVAPAT